MGKKKAGGKGKGGAKAEDDEQQQQQQQEEQQQHTADVAQQQQQQQDGAAARVTGEDPEDDTAVAPQPTAPAQEVPQPAAPAAVPAQEAQESVAESGSGLGAEGAALASDEAATDSSLRAAPQPAKREMITDETVALLSKGFSDAMLPSIDALQQSLAEISQAQSVLLASVRHESAAVAADVAFREIEETMSKVPVYTAKLANIRKEMLALHDKATKMKKRADKLRARKEKEDAAAALAREKEREREAQLLARPAENLVRVE